MNLEQRLARLEDLRPRTTSDSRERLLAQIKRTYDRLPPNAALDGEFLRRASGIELAAIAIHRDGPCAELFEQRVQSMANQPGVPGKLFSAILRSVDQ